jgi:hypothetical protein
MASEKTPFDRFKEATAKILSIPKSAVLPPAKKRRKK